MKAIVYTHYGPPNVLKLEEIQKPTPGDDEILVEVHAASVTYSNLVLVRGEPFVDRLAACRREGSSGHVGRFVSACFLHGTGGSDSMKHGR